jgi:putative peptidoglycan lipid II flippase
MILMTGTILANGLSFVKSLLIASYYGTSAELDAYFLSLAPYRLIEGVLIGVIQVTLIPRYLELTEKKGKDYAFAVFVTFTCWIILLVMVVIIAFLWGSSSIASYLGTGFEPSRVAFTALLLKISMAFLALRIINDLWMCLFQARRQFFFTGFAPLLSGVCSLGYIVGFRSQGVLSLMYGLIFGMLVQTGVTLYNTRRLLPNRVFFLPFLHPEIRKTGALMFPLLLGSSFGHINLVVDQMMASMLPAGSIAALNYASKLHSVLTEMFVMVISRAILPFLAQQVAENDIQAMKDTFSLTIKRTLYVLLPISVFIVVFGRFMVQLVFQRGAFTAHSTSATAGAWIAYTLGLPAQAIGILTARVYNALQDNKTLMYVAGISIGLNILFNWIFMKIWGHIGIALSTSMLQWVTTFMLGYFLHKKIKR